MLGTMIVAGRAVVHGHMTLGGWVAVQSWVVSLFAPLNFLGKTNFLCVFVINVSKMSESFLEMNHVCDFQLF